MEENKIIIGNIEISIDAFKKVIRKELNEFDSFVTKDLSVILEDNNIEIGLTLEFKINLKTYKAVVNMVENKIFSAIHYFASIKSNIRIRIK